MPPEEISGDYERREITHALSGHDEEKQLRIKVIGDANESHWLMATPAQVRVIREVLGGGGIVDIGAACEAAGIDL